MARTIPKSQQIVCFLHKTASGHLRQQTILFAQKIQLRATLGYW